MPSRGKKLSDSSTMATSPTSSSLHGRRSRCAATQALSTTRCVHQPSCPVFLLHGANDNVDAPGDQSVPSSRGSALARGGLSQLATPLVARAEVGNFTGQHRHSRRKIQLLPQNHPARRKISSYFGDGVSAPRCRRRTMASLTQPSRQSSTIGQIRTRRRRTHRMADLITLRFHTSITPFPDGRRQQRLRSAG